MLAHYGDCAVSYTCCSDQIPGRNNLRFWFFISEGLVHCSQSCLVGASSTPPSEPGSRDGEYLFWLQRLFSLVSLSGHPVLGMVPSTFSPLTDTPRSDISHWLETETELF